MPGPGQPGGGSTGGSAQQVASGIGGSIFGPLGALGGSIIGGLFGRSGQNSANEANLAIARENRAWQERMSNTAYQRSAADLSKAGLNRILALGQPATTPAGNIATMQNKEAKLQEGIQTGITAGISAKLMQANIANINARTQLTNAQRDVIRPATEIGGTLGSAIARGREGFMGNITNDSGVLGTLEHKMTSGFRTAKDWVLNKAKAPIEHRKLIIKSARGMDQTSGMTDNQVYQWAIRHPDELERYLKRKQRQSQ